MSAAVPVANPENRKTLAESFSDSRSSASNLGQRVVSVDVFRGLVMMLMLLEISTLSEFAGHQFDRTGSAFWGFIQFHTSHVEWFGCSLHDLIQPGFSFLVGTSMALSILARKQRGDSFGKMFFHSISRSMILIFLGIFLRSLGHSQTRFTFDDTLTQIGLGYTFLFLIAWLPSAIQYISLTVILIGYWGIFVAYPTPSVDFDYAAVGVPAEWEHHRSGFESHWNKNSNAAWAFDVYWMNLFPREKAFEYAAGGYATLSFIPTLGTMLLGLFAGSWFSRVSTLKGRSIRFLLAMGLCAGLAISIDAAGYCPIIKRIWTPTWTLYSGAWCFGFMYLLHLICDVAGFQRWSFPWRVIGANSIAAYVMSWTLDAWAKDNFQRHFAWFFDGFSEPVRELWLGSLTLLIIWLVLFWMYRRNILIRI